MCKACCRGSLKCFLLALAGSQAVQLLLALIRIDGIDFCKAALWGRPRHGVPVHVPSNRALCCQVFRPPTPHPQAREEHFFIKDFVTAFAFRIKYISHKIPRCSPV